MKNSIRVAAFHHAKRDLTYIIWQTLNDVTFTNGALHRLCFSKSYHNHNWYKYLYFLTISSPFVFDRKQHKGKVRLCRITPDFLHSGRELLLKIATSWTHKLPPTCLTQKKEKKKTHHSVCHWNTCSGSVKTNISQNCTGGVEENYHLCLALWWSTPAGSGSTLRFV